MFWPNCALVGTQEPGAVRTYKEAIPESRLWEYTLPETSDPAVFGTVQSCPHCGHPLSLASLQSKQLMYMY